MAGVAESGAHRLGERGRRGAALSTTLSPATIRIVGWAAAMVSFAETSALLRELAGMAVDPNRWCAPLKRLVRRLLATSAA